MKVNTGAFRFVAAYVLLVLKYILFCFVSCLFINFNFDVVFVISVIFVSFFYFKYQPFSDVFKDLSLV